MNRHSAFALSLEQPSPELLDALSGFFRLLSEPSRLRLLCALKQGRCDVATLMSLTGFSQSHISRQLSQLQSAGLVSSRRSGNRLLYCADDHLVDDLCELVQRRLQQRLSAQLQGLKP